MPDEISQPSDLSVLSWVEGAVGAKLLAYILALEVDQLPALMARETHLNSQQVDVVNNLAAVKAAMPSQLDDASETQAIRAWITQIDPEGNFPVATLLRRHVTGQSETTPETSSDLESALVNLALNAYPAYLLTPDPAPFPMPFSTGRPSIRVAAALISRNRGAAFTDAAQEDEVFKKVFQHHQQHIGAYGMIMRNTGGGGSIQLVTFPEMLLSSAWRHLKDGNASAESFVAQALRELQFAREVFEGKPHSITAKVALMGVLLPSLNSRMELPNGYVRAVTDEDRKLAPEDLKAQLAGSDSVGNTVVINYDGDLILEYQYPYQVRLLDRPMDAAPPEFTEYIQTPAELDDALLRLRFSLMLAAEREHRVQIIQTWRYFEDPLNSGHAISWSDPRQGVPIMPIQLTEAELVSWGDWYKRLDTVHVTRISLALSRILRALAERREPSDVLIDAVIAWENLFGTREGEPTFRVSTCLAVLLEDTLQARTELRKRLAKIYALRSKIVHGSANLNRDEYPMCDEALEVAIRAIRVLTTTRDDILKLPDGAARSTTLLLGSSSAS
jgi:hypothetical protein